MSYFLTSLITKLQNENFFKVMYPVDQLINRIDPKCSISELMKLYETYYILFNI